MSIVCDFKMREGEIVLSGDIIELGLSHFVTFGMYSVTMNE